jgi:hypothetical protein
MSQDEAMVHGRAVWPRERLARTGTALALAFAFDRQEGKRRTTVNGRTHEQALLIDLIGQAQASGIHQACVHGRPAALHALPILRCGIDSSTRVHCRGRDPAGRSKMAGSAEALFSFA